MKPIDPGLWQDRYVAPDKIENEFRGDKGRGWLMRWLPSRAHDNGMFLVFSNGVGEDDGEVRTGNAMILDPYGRILVETWAPRDELLFADLDLDLLPLSTGDVGYAGVDPSSTGHWHRRWDTRLAPVLRGFLQRRWSGRGEPMDESACSKVSRSMTFPILSPRLTTSATTPSPPPSSP
jgi:hypothetical protein